MTVLIANDEGSRDLVNYSPLDAIGVLSYLRSGDICFTGNGPSSSRMIGIELKNIDDVISSRRTGRLQGISGQVEHMLSDYDELWMLTYGSYRCGANGDLEIPRRTSDGTKWVPHSNGRRGQPTKYAYVQSLLVSLSDIGFRCQHVYDKQQAAYWIAMLYHKRSKPWTEQQEAFRVFNESADAGKFDLDRASRDNASALVSAIPTKLNPITELRARIAKQFKGIGYDRALSIAQYYSTIDQMMQAASRGEWHEVDGVGSVVAESVQRSCVTKSK